MWVCLVDGKVEENSGALDCFFFLGGGVMLSMALLDSVQWVFIYLFIYVSIGNGELVLDSVLWFFLFCFPIFSEQLNVEILIGLC